MLADFIATHRRTIIARTQARVASRTCPKADQTEMTHGIPLFLDQLGAALQRAESSDPENHAELSRSAGLHGGELLRRGLTIAQVVHDYGDVCQVVTLLAVEQNAPIPSHEFRALNMCLDDAIAEAVTEYSSQRELAITNRSTERLGVLAHELRNLLNTAMLAFESIQNGTVAPDGRTGLVHGRCLLGLRDLVDRSLAEVRLDAGVQHFERIPISEFIEEVEISALMQARARGLQLAVSSVHDEIAIEGDRQVLAAAVSNLLQNAFKFTHRGGTVTLRASATEERVLIEVEDECGGLPPGKAEELFEPFEQRGADRTGIGLGLSICRKAARASAGELLVRDLPGKGCIFALELPRCAPDTARPLAGMPQEDAHHLHHR